MELDIIDALGGTELLGGLNRNQLELVARVAKRRDVEAGAVIIEQGQNMTHMAIVARGEAEVHVDGVKVGVVGPTDVVGELSLIDAAPASATVSFPQGGSVWLLARAGFIPVWESNRAEISTAMLMAVTKKLRETNSRLAS